MALPELTQHALKSVLLWLVFFFLFSVGCALLGDVSRTEDSRLRTKLIGATWKNIYSCEPTEYYVRIRARREHFVS